MLYDNIINLIKIKKRRIKKSHTYPTIPYTCGGKIKEKQKKKKERANY